MCLNGHYIVLPRIWTHDCASQKISTLASNNPKIILLSFYTVIVSFVGIPNPRSTMNNQLITFPLHIESKMFVLFNRACLEHIYTTI
jgi:hypothetical protein